MLIPSYSFQINKLTQIIELKTLLHPSYFPDIRTFSTLVQNDIIWEVEDNYQKQTFRNRTYIANDRGIHALSIPIKHVGDSQGRQKYKDVRIENVDHWQRQHWRTLQTAYRTSPFFEYYEDEIVPLYDKQYDFLLDFNIKTVEIVCDCLQIEMPLSKTSSYERSPNAIVDARFLVNCKREIGFVQEEYVQVFGSRHSFIKNTSVLDLLFNEGTNALTYLKNQNTDFLHA